MPVSDGGDLSVTADVPLTTIVVIEKESYSATIRALETLVAHTPQPRRIVVVDSGAPRGARRRLERFAEEHDLMLAVSRTLLNANEERNFALRYVHTEYVAFVDNDSIVPPGWLSTLERCARETGAALVIPVVTWGPPDDVTIHYAGGMTRIADDGGARSLEHEEVMNHGLDELASLERAPTTAVETHCVLARADVLRRIGPLDESLMNIRDHIDLGFRFTSCGAAVWLEPAVVVHYLWPRRLRWRDLAFYSARWSDEWIERSHASFNAAWNITVPTLDDAQRDAYRKRRLRRAPWPAGWRGRLARTRFRLRVRLDRFGTPRVVRHFDRQRARATPPRIVHAASWGGTPRPIPTVHR
jgi:GT2 family glycosyltransferase